MAYVQPGELRHFITILNAGRSVDPNGHYFVQDEIIQAKAGIYKGSGRDMIADGAAHSVDSVTFIVRWGVREKISRDAIIKYDKRAYMVDWMDAAPWAQGYARVVAVSNDGEEM